MARRRRLRRHNWPPERTRFGTSVCWQRNRSCRTRTFLQSTKRRLRRRRYRRLVPRFAHNAANNSSGTMRTECTHGLACAQYFSTPAISLCSPRLTRSQSGICNRTLMSAGIDDSGPAHALPDVSGRTGRVLSVAALMGISLCRCSGSTVDCTVTGCPCGSDAADGIVEVAAAMVIAANEPSRMKTTMRFFILN